MIFSQINTNPDFLIFLFVLTFFRSEKEFENNSCM